jgi:uncharacterized coiled-coil protein SlyX
MPKRINHDREARIMRHDIERAGEFETDMVQVYSPLINHRLFDLFFTSETDMPSQASGASADGQAPPAYEHLYPEVALPQLDMALSQQVLLGNFAETHEVAQFPFMAFERKLRRDLDAIAQRLKDLQEFEDRSHVNFHDLTKRTNGVTAQACYSPLENDSRGLRERLTMLQKKLSLLDRRMAFLPGTKGEQKRFSEWELAQNQQRIETRLGELERQVTGQGTSIRNLQIAAAAAQHGLETTRQAIEVSHATHHPDCQHDCVRGMCSITEYFAPVAQLLNFWFSGGH